MKNLYSYLLFLSIFFCTSSNAQSWQWARVGLVPDGCQVNTDNWANATDKWGNVYMAGSLGCTQVTFGTTTLSNVNSTRMTFVVKYDSLGNVIWAKKGDPTCNTAVETQSIAVDTLGNVYVGGYIGCNMAFGSLSIQTNGDSHFFIVKFDQNGNEVWVRHAGDNVPVDNNLAIDSDGNVIVAGCFMWPLTIGSYTLTTNGGYDIFIAKYSSSGTVLWAKNYGNGGEQEINDVVCDASGNIYLAGQFSNSGSSATFTLGTTTLTAPMNQRRNFLTKLNPSGNVIWAKQSEYSGGSSWPNSMVLDALGNIYLSSALYDSIRYDNMTLQNYPFTSTQGKFNFHVAKFNDQGAVQWLRRGGSPDGTEYVDDITLDAAGNVWISGQLGLHPMEIGTLTATPSSTVNNSFIARLDAATGDPTYLSAVHAGGSEATGLAGDRFGNVYLSHAHQGQTATIAGTQIGGPLRHEPYIAKLCTGCPLGTSFVEFGPTIKIYPNPATDKIVIEGNEGAKEVVVLNLFGQEVVRQRFATRDGIVDIKELPAGVYVVVVSDKAMTGKATRTIVKR